MMQIRGIDLMVYRVTDMDRSLSFYRDTLGLELTYLHDPAYYAEFSVSPTILAICVWEKVPYDVGFDIPPFQAGDSSVYLAVDDIHSTVKELKSKGVKIFASPFESPVCWMTVIEDPDGNRVTLHQRKDGSFG